MSYLVREKHYVYPFKTADKFWRDLVWGKATPIQGYDSNFWRSDACGKVMNYFEHGNTNSKYGWEIDHILPVARGGRTELHNLQALNWAVNRKKSDTYPWYCSML